MTENSDTPIYDDMNLDKPEPIIGPITTELPVAEPDKQSAKPQPKVIAATVGAGVGSAIGEIVVWLVEASTGVDVPGNVELAIGVVLTAGLAFISGYVKRN